MKAIPEVEIVSAVDVSREIVEDYIEKHLADVETKPAVYDDLDQLLAESKPDAVLISTPHTLHFEQCMKALDAGCHVFVEKPMVTSADDGYRLAQKVEETGKILVIGYNTACSPYLAYIKEQIQNETFGKLEMVTGYLTQGWYWGTKGKWRQDPALSGGGQAYDSGAHLLNSLCWPMESKIAEVQAFIDKRDTPVDINSVINARFENGVLAAIAISGSCRATGGSHMAFIFEDARIELDGWNASWMRVYTKDGEVEDLGIDETPVSPDQNFIDAILGRAEPKTRPLNGIIQSELMDAIYTSAETGRPARPKQQSIGA